MTNFSITLDKQLDLLGVSYTLILDGLPGQEGSVPTTPVIIKINDRPSVCIMSETSILTGDNLPKGFDKIEPFSTLSQKNIAISMGLERMTLIFDGMKVYFDEKLADNEFIILPIGDKNSHLKMKTFDLICAFGDRMDFVKFPQIEILPADYICDRDFNSSIVRGRMGSVTVIPPFPITARAIFDLYIKNDFNINSLAHILERDAPISSAILSWSNSALFKASDDQDPISSVRDAIKRLGTEMTMSYALVNSMKSSFSYPKNLTPLVRSTSFDSLHCAYGARVISGETNDGLGDKSYIAGLLHNMGELFMVMCFPERSGDYLKAQDINPQLSSDLLSREIFGVSFSHSTEILANEWNMPKSIQDTFKALSVSHKDTNTIENKVAKNIQQWKTLMLRAGNIPFSSAPNHHESIISTDHGKKIIEKSKAKINEFLSFSMTISDN